MLKYVNKLFSLKTPYKTKESDELFVKAMAQNCKYHYDHCEEYKRILDDFGFSPESITHMDDLSRLPFLPTLYLKKHPLISVKESRMTVKASSSGTGGVKSYVGLNFGTLFRAFKMVQRVAKYHKLRSLKPTRYVVFGYRPHRGNQLGAAKTAYLFTYLAPAFSRSFALEWKDGSYKLDLDDIKEKLIKYASGKLPVRTMGFPAYTYFLLREMKEQGIRIKLPKGSMICLGGGWKQFYAEKVDKQDFYALADEVLGIDDKHIVEFFGAVEHPILYTDCKYHRFHVPVYGRVIIRDVDTLEPVQNGKPGLVNLLTPIFDTMPMLSILTDDIGILHDEPCECGEGQWLEILGRVGIKDIITCAQGAEEMLKTVMEAL